MVKLAEFDPVTGTAESFLNFEALLTNGDVDIDAIAEHPSDGRVIFSTLNDAEFALGPNAGLAFTSNDILIYDPVSMSASILVEGDLFVGSDPFINVSGLSMVDDDTIAIAANTGGVADTSIGGVIFQRNDAILLNLQSGQASTLIEGALTFEGPPNPGIDSLHVVAIVPEPKMLISAILAFAIAVSARRRASVWPSSFSQ